MLPFMDMGFCRLNGMSRMLRSHSVSVRTAFIAKSLVLFTSFLVSPGMVGNLLCTMFVMLPVIDEMSKSPVMSICPKSLVRLM